MKSFPVIVTEGEEVANHHSTASERTREEREMHGGPEGKTEANGGEALRIKAILVTTQKLTSSPKAFLMAEGVGRSGPICMYSATPLCCASQTEVVEGLLLGEWPSPCKG
jgi:hypothetical protein